MAAAAPAREAFCTKCTKAAPVHQLTLDPGHPMVRCVKVARDGSEHGCGVQVGTYDEGEAIANVRERRRVIANAHHQDHLSYRKPHPLCDACKAAPPVKPVAPHDFETFPRKYRTAAHLELVHHNRDKLPQLPLRSAQELEDHHRQLHTLGGAK